MAECAAVADGGSFQTRSRSGVVLRRGKVGRAFHVELKEESTVPKALRWLSDEVYTMRRRLALYELREVVRLFDRDFMKEGELHEEGPVRKRRRVEGTQQGGHQVDVDGEGPEGDRGGAMASASGTVSSGVAACIQSRLEGEPIDDVNDMVSEEEEETNKMTREGGPLDDVIEIVSLKMLEHSLLVMKAEMIRIATLLNGWDFSTGISMSVKWDVAEMREEIMDELQRQYEWLKDELTGEIREVKALDIDLTLDEGNSLRRLYQQIMGLRQRFERLRDRVLDTGLSADEKEEDKE